MAQQEQKTNFAICFISRFLNGTQSDNTCTYKFGKRVPLRMKNERPTESEKKKPPFYLEAVHCFIVIETSTWITLKLFVQFTFKQTMNALSIKWKHEKMFNWIVSHRLINKSVVGTHLTAKLRNQINSIDEAPGHKERREVVWCT